MTTPRWIAMLLGTVFALHFQLASAAKSLVLTIYPHNDMASMSDGEIHDNYVQPWLDEMRTFTDHSIEVIFQRNLPGITDIDYQHATAEQTHQTFAHAVRYQGAGFKYILFARNYFGTGESGAIAGLAAHGSPYAIVSSQTYSAIGHELGHLMDATHEAAEVKLNPWFCETYVYPQRNVLRSNCYRYSDANRLTIAEHLDRLLND